MLRTRTVHVLVIATALILAACGGNDPASVAIEPGPDVPPTRATSQPDQTTNNEADPTSRPAVPTQDTPGPVPDGVPTLTPAAIPSSLDLVLTLMIDVDRPTDLATRAGSDNLFIATEGGLVLEMAVSEGGGQVVRELIDISAQITDGSETGLLGIVFSPDGALLYLSYSDHAGDNNVVEMAMVDELPDPSTRRTVLIVEQPAGNHNGGDIEFGPDGFLYVALGDGGGGGDPFANGQDTSTLLGSILRIDPNGDPYDIPDDNPFANGGGAPEIFLYGVRNPWRISFDSATGDLWIGDVGQDEVEELDVLYATDGSGRGANLGWSRVEGTAPFNESGPPTENYVAPVYQYLHNEGCSVTGGYVYRGQALPELFGSYIFGDFCAGQIWGLASNQGDEVLGRFDLGLDVEGEGLTSFGQGLDGELYVLSHGGPVYRIDPAG